MTDTIEGQSCVKLDDWTAAALPKGTVLCPDVDTRLATYTSATNMSCAAVEATYQAGVAEMRKSAPGQATARFDDPGWRCAGGGADPIVSTECTRGDEVFRLPAG